MNLSERLRELEKSRTIIRRIRLPVSLKIERSHDQVSLKYDQVAWIETVDYDALVSKLRLVAKSNSISLLTPREMRLAASCLFEGEMPLADDLEFLDKFLEALRPIRSRVAIKRLIHTYFNHFDPSSQSIQRIGTFLQEVVSTIPTSRHWIWEERHQQLRLFDPANVVGQLAILAVETLNPRRAFEEKGLGGQLMVSSLCAAAFLKVLQLTEAELSINPKSEDVDRVVTWLDDGESGMLYSANRGAIANAFLLPWTRRNPEPEVRQKIQSFLLDKLSDPRIDGGPWLGAQEAALDVMTGWLAQATLEQFLKVVDRVAAKHQWEYRRAFWNSYIERRVVEKAWVAFGSSGADVARAIAESTTDTFMRRFATLSGSGSDQAVLLLSIGDLIIADWSHNGRLRIWRRGNPSAPQFNLQSYVASELRTDSEFDTVHLPPDGWQGKAEAYIRRHTGIRLLESEYMPHRAGL